MTERKIYGAAFGPYHYDDNVGISDPDGDFSGMLEHASVSDGGHLFAFLDFLDTDHSNHLTMKWNEDDSANRILNLLVAGGDRSLTLNENLTIGDGFDVTITAEDAAGSIVLDEQTFEVEGEGTATQLTKLVNANNAAATLTLEGVASVINQDVTTDASPTFVTETLTGLTASQLVKTDASKILTSTVGTVEIPICMDYFDALPARGSESNWHGGLLALDTGGTLNNGAPFVMTTKGVGKIILVVNDGGGDDMVGDITATGTVVDRNTGVHTGGQTSVMTLTGVTTDNTTVDANGNTVHEFIKAYITDKWFYGVVTLTTTDVSLTDLDTYHISFEQVNDQSDLVLNTFDANIYCSGASGEFDAYLHTLHITGDECNIDNEAELHMGSIGSSAALANKYFRLRQGNINEAVDGATDGFWVDIHYKGTPIAVEDVTVSVWFTKTVTVALS